MIYINYYILQVRKEMNDEDSDITDEDEGELEENDPQELTPKDNMVRRNWRDVEESLERKILEKIFN